MGVDRRRDHSMRVPRPDLSVALGTPNACTGCHTKKSAKWAADKVVQWYGPRREGTFDYAFAVEAGRKGRPEGEKDLRVLVSRRENGQMIRATALSLLGRYTSEASRLASRNALSDPEALVRFVAVRNLERFGPANLPQRLGPLLHDPVRLVRTEAARALAPAAGWLAEAERAAFDRAAAEYEQRELMANDQAESHHNLGIFYANLGRHARAKSSYRMALRIDPDFYAAGINLATVYSRLGRRGEAERALRQVIEGHPEIAEARYDLGLLLAEEDERLEEAVEELKEAARLNPTRARIKYNLGLALQRLGRHGEAEGMLLEANRLAPGTDDFTYALAVLYAQLQRWEEALPLAERLIRLDPGDRRWQNLLALVRRHSE